MILAILLPMLGMAIPSIATTNTSPRPIPSPAPAKNDSACTLAASALHSIAVSRPTPSTAFTAYMDAHGKDSIQLLALANSLTVFKDPFLNHCLASFPSNLTEYFTEAYFEEASWYNAAHDTVGSLVKECDGDEEFAKTEDKKKKTWRERGLREGLPASWAEFAKKFGPCNGRGQVGETKDGEGKEGKKGDGEKGGEDYKPTKASGGRTNMNDTGRGEGSQVQENVGMRLSAILAVVVGVVMVHIICIWR